MRTIILFLLAFTITGICLANEKTNKASALKWLQENLVHQQNNTNKPKGLYETRMCIDYNVKSKGAVKELTDKIFNTTLRSFVSWKDTDLVVENEVIEKGKLKETYIYHIPITAIKRVWQTNCQRNTNDNVNAYTYRPIFLEVKKNKVKITHVYAHRVDMTTVGMNSTEGDWGTVIPITGNWDKNEALKTKIIQAFETVIGQK